MDKALLLSLRVHRVVKRVLWIEELQSPVHVLIEAWLLALLTLLLAIGREFFSLSQDLSPHVLLFHVLLGLAVSTENPALRFLHAQRRFVVF